MIFPLAEDFLKTLKTIEARMTKFAMRIDGSVTHLVAWRFELASSMSGSGDGFGDFEDDCMCDESCTRGVSNLFMFLSNLYTNLFHLENNASKN